MEKCDSPVVATSAGALSEIIEDGGTEVPAKAPHTLQDLVALVAELLQAMRDLRWHVVLLGSQCIDQHVKTAGEAGQGLGRVVMELSRDAEPFALLGLEDLRDVEAQVLF